MAHRRRRRSAPSRTREGLVVAIAIEKDLPERGRSSVEGGRTRVDWLTPHLTPYPGAASGQICRIQACFSRQRWSGRTQHVYLHPRPRATAPYLTPPTAPAPLPPPSP